MNMPFLKPLALSCELVEQSKDQTVPQDRRAYPSVDTPSAAIASFRHCPGVSKELN